MNKGQEKLELDAAGTETGEHDNMAPFSPVRQEPVSELDAWQKSARAARHKHTVRSRLTIMRCAASVWFSVMQLACSRCFVGLMYLCRSSQPNEEPGAGAVVLCRSRCVQARQQALAHVLFMGHLFRKGMVTEKMMHECIKKLLAGFQAPQQANVEQLIQLMSTAGAQLDSNHNATVYIDAYSKLIARLSRDMRLATRLRYMLQASIQSCWSAAGSQNAV